MPGEHRRILDRIARLDVGALPECLALARDRDWPPEEHKWRLLFTVGTVYGVRDDAGDLVGAAVLTAYGTGLAAISMVLVAARYGRRGVGHRLMARALALWVTETIRALRSVLGGRPAVIRIASVVATEGGDDGRAGPDGGVAGAAPAS